MNECFSRFFILNGDAVSADAFSNSLVYEGESVYEVLRMMNGVPVFFSDHMERLELSVRNIGREMLAGREAIKMDIRALHRSDRKKEVNLKIVFNYKEASSNYLIYHIEPIYPAPGQYKSGVKGILCHAERTDPSSKVVNHKLRTTIYHRLILEGGYEALLVNADGLITEGSRSNIFFLKNDVLFTAPETVVLSGITRKHLLNICDELKVPVRFECVNINDLNSYESVFMTGTSPIVLPFNSINDIHFRVDHPLIGRLREIYIERMALSVREFRDWN